MPTIIATVTNPSTGKKIEAKLKVNNRGGTWAKHIEKDTYRIVNAFNDNDNNIYLVDNKGNPTNEIIAETRRPYDFLFTDEVSGGFVYNDKYCGITFSLSNLTITGQISMPDGRIERITKGDFWSIENWINRIYIAELETKGKVMSSTEQLLVLANLSKNRASFDLKVSLKFPEYSAVYVGFNEKRKPIITTLRATGNFVFGSNMRITSNTVGMDSDMFYSMHMLAVGAYNVLQNGGAITGGGRHPYYGEHKYSGSYIYYGYYGKFYD